eukprot:9254528-Pyramimonas_sp.AAC.2
MYMKCGVILGLLVCVAETRRLSWDEMKRPDQDIAGILQQSMDETFDARHKLVEPRPGQMGLAEAVGKPQTPITSLLDAKVSSAG